MTKTLWEKTSCGRSWKRWNFLYSDLLILNHSLVTISIHGKLLLTCGSRSNLQSNSSSPMLKQLLVENGVRIFHAPSESQLLSGPTAEAEVPEMNQKPSVPHELTEPWMLAGLPRLQECSIRLSAQACMGSYCGDTNFCSMMSSLPSLWKVSLDILIFLRQTVPTSSIHLVQASQTPPTGCATKLLTAHPTIFHTPSTRHSSCFWSLAPPRSPRLVASPTLFPFEH